ncbi:T9SS type A sorting domain-containing protein [Flavobacterium sp. MFBS3-15]|uniref:DUF7619 domain-containing protein n=1 Tax=Flavobacterium sp. MFBS3-15 TaxID=2989816 RepID=UPI00223627FF|nr:T9SS type A sorting domain-containing protein [Flavobacterium sp. MFBS3-15]MCW4469629.1 T9SS type A sorting domain-containing protein [Flavobacterium sp. MFBS3-15]
MKKKLLFLGLLMLLCLKGMAQAEAYPVPDINQCNYEVFDLTVQTPVTLANQSPAEYIVTYHLSWEDADNNVNPIANPQAFMITTGNIEQALYIRVTNIATGEFDTTSFVISMWNGAIVPELNDVTACGSFILPALSSGNYYTGPNGSGTLLPAGTAITTSMALYIYAEQNGCSDQTMFMVTIGNTSAQITLDSVAECIINDMVTYNLEPWIANVWLMYPDALNVQIFETYEDAETNATQNAIQNINNYTITQPVISGQVQVLYIRVDTGNCIWIVQLPLIAIECSNITVSGHISFDADGNGCTENDPPASGIAVYYTLNNQIDYAYTDADGNYTFYNVPTGTISVQASPYYPYNMVSTPTAHTVSVSDVNVENINFCLTPPAPINDVAVYLAPLNGAQPGFTAAYALVIQNFGNTTASGTVALQYNDTQLDYLQSWPSMTALPGMLAFEYTNMQPYGYQIIYIDFQVAMPGIVNLGDIITFTSTISINGAADAFPSNNTDILDQVSVNSWDPNDINVREGEEITEAQADGYLHYTIRFQNEGNANAHNVRIETMLDGNLDWNTFEPMIGSHTFQAERSGNGNEVTFRFNDIQLPGAMVNEPDSHGYVMYRIKPKTSVVAGDSMSGQAGIYFDFNPVIETNTITTTVMSAAGINENTANGFVMYPNPASAKITLQMIAEVNGATVTVTDVLGKTVANAKLQGTQSDLDVSSLKSGVYFVTLNADGKTATQKLVVK